MGSVLAKDNMNKFFALVRQAQDLFIRSSRLAGENLMWCIFWSIHAKLSGFQSATILFNSP
jgi:hypothetical protein